MSGFPPVAGPPQVACRKCGYKVSLGASVCGNCGNRLGGRVAGRGPAFTPSPVPRGLIKALMSLVVLGGVFLAFSGDIQSLVDDIGEAFRSATDSDGGDPSDSVPGGGPFGIPGDTKPESVKGYSGVRELAKDLSRGGLRCTQVKVDAQDDYVSTGSCQADGVHVQINVYFTQASVDSVEDSLDDSSFSFVHKDNWFVITQEHVARRVHKILGGRLVRAR